MEALRQFRLMAVRGSLVLTGVAALGAAVLGQRVVGLGLLLGGVAGTLGFWLVAYKLERLAILQPGKVKLFAYKWTVIRLTIYALALTRAYFLDRDTLFGLYGAVAGLFIVRIVVVLLGLTGWDLARGKQAVRDETPTLEK